MKEKSKYNACPICKLPRGKGPHEFSHGACIEQRAKTDGKKLTARTDKRFSHLTVEQEEKGRNNHSTKRYLSGKLPNWMYS